MGQPTITDLGTRPVDFGKFNPGLGYNTEEGFIFLWNGDWETPVLVFKDDNSGKEPAPEDVIQVKLDKTSFRFSGEVNIADIVERYGEICRDIRDNMDAMLGLDPGGGTMIVQSTNITAR